MFFGKGEVEVRPIDNNEYRTTIRKIVTREIKGEMISRIFHLNDGNVLTESDFWHNWEITPETPNKNKHIEV